MRRCFVLFNQYRKDAICHLHGRFLRSWLLITAVQLSYLLFVASVFLCIWLLIVDTSFLGNLKIFNSNYSIGIICALAVIVNVTLYFVALAVKLKCECYIADISLKITLDMLIKYATMQFVVAIRKIVAFVMFILPFILFSFITDKIVKSGITSFVFFVLISSYTLLFTSAIISYFLYIQKYSALTLMFVHFPEDSIKSIFRHSEQITDGKCDALLCMKIYNIPKKLTIFLPIAKVMELKLITENKKPYVHSESHTEKSVVFYFDSIKEC